MTNATVIRFLALALLWGGSFTLIKVSLEGLSPAQLVLARLALGALVLAVIAAVRQVGLPRGGTVWGHLTGAALFGQVLPFLLLSYGERSAGAGVAGVLIGATPLLTLTIAYAALSAERATARKVVGLLIGFAGIVVVLAPWREAPGSLGGEIACFGAAVSYAISFVYVRRFLSPRGLAPLSLAAGQLLVAVVLQALASPLLEWGTVRLTSRVLVSIVLLGVLSTGLAYVLYFRLIGDIGATSASAVNYVVPVAAVGVGVLFLSEPVTWNLLVGGLIVLAGMAYAEKRLTRRPAAAEIPPARRGTA
ncbi:DMT family transporter [Jidongwangia harbinensis]|uniref:DMT family transporter n=1 Tax=Jidongwangia harbinensis TaxID=2878561 RepID=UPI001CD9D3A9|nr:DMT family transporter [Jidongwangia harbinensis]MCA2214280.1 DMT family transporter [Jidongwangia harbinensis]